MTSYKQPSLDDRQAMARDAKRKALDQLRAKPAPDEAVMAERRAASLQREEAAAEKRRTLLAEREQAKAEKAARAAEAALALQKAAAPVLTDAEKQAARDARYAARKNRKKAG